MTNPTENLLGKDTRPGRAQEQKLAEAICDVFEEVMSTRDVYVLLRTTAAEDHIAGGVPLPEWRPDDIAAT